jgi:hypothetical protein
MVKSQQGHGLLAVVHNRVINCYVWVHELCLLDVWLAVLHAAACSHTLVLHILIWQVVYLIMSLFGADLCREHTSAVKQCHLRME